MTSINNLSKKCLLIIMDGFGINPSSNKNAIEEANKPHLDELIAHYPMTLLEPGGELVGLPKGIAGNSEVGHMNLGAGRPVRQDLVRINEAIENNSIKDMGPYKNLVAAAQNGNKRIHLIGLLSDGGVHSHINHLIHIHQLLKSESSLEIFFHAFMDGRDTAKNVGEKYLLEIEKHQIKLASIQGRSIGMDRDRRWEKIKHCYQTLIGQGKIEDIAPIEYLKQEYDQERFDEFITPALLLPEGAIRQDDTLFFLNFRPDRAVQLSLAFNYSNFKEFEVPIKPNFYLCMTPYIPDECNLPILFDKEKLNGTLSEYLSSLNLKQLKIAETEKYAHVTFFFNGGEKKEFPNEKHLLIPSPKEVATYDLKPEMSAFTVTENLLTEIGQDNFDFYLVNFANCDMVGHTGNFSATVKAVETVDSCIGKLVQKCTEKNITVLITADHGNADQMEHEDGTPHTSHSDAHVPFIIYHQSLKDLEIKENNQATKSLQDVAPTVLSVMGKNQPESFFGKPLFL